VRLLRKDGSILPCFSERERHPGFGGQLCNESFEPL
jgi:hypothetical protein